MKLKIPQKNIEWRTCVANKTNTIHVVIFKPKYSEKYETKTNEPK